MDNATESLGMRYRVPSTDDAKFAKLLVQEQAAAEELARQQSAWTHHRFQSQQTNAPSTTAEETTEITLSYVDRIFRTHVIQRAREVFSIQLDMYLFENGIEPIVPVPSIARAIENYLYEMTAGRRNLVPMERVAGEPWRKLKRGARRIYILEKDGQIFIHFMKRKEWKHAPSRKRDSERCRGLRAG
ncbi:MAG: hypothetical protein QM790_07680 [Nibricoccus sp.]